MARRTDIAIFEGNRLFREGLASILKEANYRIVVSLGAAAEIESRDLGSDSRIVFLIGEKPSGGFDAAEIAALKERYPKSHVLLLLETCSNEQRWLAEKSGVSGVLLKSISGEVLSRTIELVLLGEHVFSVSSAPVSAKPPEVGTEVQVEQPAVHPPLNGVPVVLAADNTGERISRRGQLSEREVEILNCLVEGKSNKLIARRCSITEATVKVHLKAILRKIECANRTQAAIWALSKMKPARPEMIDVAFMVAGKDAFPGERMADERLVSVP